MPTYEYACTSCGSHLEIVQRFDDEPLSACPSCGGVVRKVFGSIGIAFKGSGFYKTDNRSSVKREAGSPDKAGTSEKSEKEAGGSGGDGKGKPERKGSGDTAAASATAAPAKGERPAKSA
ncbi:MAG: zf-TFIIB domain-containing protein [Actinomycetota bacterium]|nr:zf-TFIIB domain-containing protein [Actinomycetota bacterium]